MAMPAASGSICCAEFQTQSSARIQLSRTNEYFPGTSDRIMMISGTVNQVLTALHLVLAKMSSEKLVVDTMLARCAVLLCSTICRSPGTNMNLRGNL